MIEAQKNIKSISVTLDRRIKEIKEPIKDIDLKPASNPGNRHAVRPGVKKPEMLSEEIGMKTGSAVATLFNNFMMN